MRAGTLVVWVTAAAALFPAATISAANAGSVRDAIDAQYTRIERAFQRKDLRTLDSILAPDFTFRDRAKTIHRSELIAGWRRWFTVLSSVQSQSHNLGRIVRHGRRATVTVRQRRQFTEDHGKYGLRHATVWGESRDTWIHTPDGWEWEQTVDLSDHVHETPRVRRR